MPDHFYVYPAYVDGSTPRSLGRRVPVGAPANVTLEEIVEAAKALGVKATAEPEKHHPPTFHRYAGRLKVTKRSGLTKTKFLVDLAAELARRRSSAPKA
jgi:signal recognition particle subunit SEC65